MAIHIRRREFIVTLGGAAAWPFAARAQQPALPVIGYLNFGSPEFDTPRLTGLRRGLSQTGYVEGGFTSRLCLRGRRHPVATCRHVWGSPVTLQYSP